MKTENAVNNKKSKLPIVLTVLLIVVLLLGGALFYVYSKLNDDNLSPAGEEKTIVFNVYDGETITEIAQELEKSGIIDSARHFIYLCSARNRGSEFKYGSYELSNRMTFEQLCSKLEEGSVSNDSIKFTITEGMWLSEIAQLVEKKGICTADEFKKECNSRDYPFDFVKEIPERENLLEGYLYPQTYIVEQGTSAHELINTMLSYFDENVGEDIKTAAKAKGITLDDAVIIASVIEGEVSAPEERELVSSVIYNRLENNMKLQMDTTVLYALGEKKQLTLDDLNSPLPHNTYYVDGLPVGPVGNPGIESIKAAVDPADTNYLYYVLEPGNTKKHSFSETYEEHLENESEYYKG